MTLRRIWFALAVGSLVVSANAAPTTEYRLSFPEAVHHVMHVEIVFRDVPAGPLQVRMSRASAGRYAAFDFAKNIFAELFTDATGHPLAVQRPNPNEWDVARHDATVRVAYDIFGDRLDGTFLAVDLTHAHLNMPASLMWSPQYAQRPSRLTFDIPPGSGWSVATQLFPTADPLTYTAPNLQYLMDSPVEVSHFVMRTFALPPLDKNGKPATLRVAIHHLGTDAEVDAYVKDLQKVMREEQAVFGEFPDFEPGYYTLLGDFVPWANSDGMEHRNSTVVTSRTTLEKGRTNLVRDEAHEFFHCWNVKRIRPADLEPFRFEDFDMSDDLWLAEGFTNYYERLVTVRSGFEERLPGIAKMSGEIGGVIQSPGVKFRSPVEMSRFAPFVDQAAQSAPDYLTNTFVSYYSVGDVVALGLDLTLRARSDSRVSLDDFMRAMWRVHGKPAGEQPGLVPKPYTTADVQARLAEVSGDPAFAADFVRRYIEGKEQLDFAPLLLRAGLILRKKNPGQATLGRFGLEKREALPLRVSSPTRIGTSAYAAGLDLDDELISVAGVTLYSPDDLPKALASHKPGDEVELHFKRRGADVHATARLDEDPQLEIVTLESTGPALTPEQQRFRDAWLGSKAN